MITVNEAKQLIGSMVKRLSPVYVPLIHASGMVTAEAVFSPIAMPLFTQSSMDGYAIQLNYIDAIMPIQDELPAGTSKQLELKEGHSIKVFTGGPVPLGADCVIQKEWVTQVDNAIQVIQKTDEKGLNIRVPGSSVQQDDLVVEKGTCLHPYQLSMMASLGINEVLVYPAPVITLIITGNELVKPGQSLHFGQVYESNSIGLAAALKSVGVNDLKIVYVRDSLEATAAEIKHALNCSDMVLLTGGVSVGDYDYVAEACKQEGVQIIFHGVKQKPGKPLLFGTHQEKLVFGLPGNPSSVLHCFHQYVKPAIAWMTGQVSAAPIKAKLIEGYQKKPGLVFFLKGFIQDGWVTILPAQASYQVGAFSKANCWVELPAEEPFFYKEQAVNIHLF